MCARIFMCAAYNGVCLLMHADATHQRHATTPKTHTKHIQHTHCVFPRHTCALPHLPVPAALLVLLLPCLQHPLHHPSHCPPQGACLHRVLMSLVARWNVVHCVPYYVPCYVPCCVFYSAPCVVYAGCMQRVCIYGVHSCVHSRNDNVPKHTPSTICITPVFTSARATRVPFGL